MAAAAVCPVVGTTNTILPPDHPSFDASKPGQVCPITKATTDHHTTLKPHPSAHIPTSLSNVSSGITTADASHCPALQNLDSADAKKLDEQVCPVVGPVTTVLPPNHPTMDAQGQDESKVCPVTNASWGHHKGKVVVHPAVEGGEGKVCPVVGHA